MTTPTRRNAFNMSPTGKQWIVESIDRLSKTSAMKSLKTAQIAFAIVTGINFQEVKAICSAVVNKKPSANKISKIKILPPTPFNKMFKTAPNGNKVFKMTSEEKQVMVKHIDEISEIPDIGSLETAQLMFSTGLGAKFQDVKNIYSAVVNKEPSAYEASEIKIYPTFRTRSAGQKQAFRIFLS